MKIRNQFIIVNSILLLYLLIAISDAFGGTPLDGIGKDLLYITFRVIELATLVYLFYFVTNVNQQKLSIISITLLVLSTIFTSMDHFLEFSTVDQSNITAEEFFITKAIYKGVPGAISLVCTLVIAVQLIRNDSTVRIYHRNLKLLGIGYFIQVAGPITVLIVAFFLELVEGLEPIYMVFYSLPPVLMVNLYWTELKSIKS